MTLLDDLQQFGCDVNPHDGWDTATNSNRDRTETAGVVVHWDAIHGWPGDAEYLYANRFGGILYHMVVDQQGVVHLYSQRYVWHAGMGDSKVLTQLRAGGPPLDGTQSNVNGNPHLFSLSMNFHPDQGPIPDAQYDATIRALAGIVTHFGLSSNQILDHACWTPRKIDVRGVPNFSLPSVRADVQALLEEPVMKAGDSGTAVKVVQEALNFWQGTRGTPGPQLTVDGQYGANTTEQVTAFQSTVGLAASGDVDGVTAGILSTYHPRFKSGGVSQSDLDAAIAGATDNLATRDEVPRLVGEALT